MVGRYEALALAAMFVASGCGGHKRLDPAALQRVESVAIVVRVVQGPLVLVAQAAPALADPPTASPVESDKRLAGQLASQMRRFEASERLRGAVANKLPPEPPWSRALPAVEVATALQALLVDDRAGDFDYEALRKRGASAVLELVVREFGVRHRDGATGVFWEGTGRLLELGSGDVLWRAPLSYDEAADPGGERRDVAVLRNGGFREAMFEMIERISDQVVAELAPGHRRQAPHAADAD
ncbi:MAG: hypothetical protein ACK4N5_01540 [Myxococcales bacterium]